MIVCTNKNCLYEWKPKVKKPVACPRCRQYMRNSGKRNGQWKGKDVSYGALHDYVKYHLTKPLNCEMCGQPKKLDLANISGEYKRDLKDWEYLCRKCHMTKDGRINKLPGIKKGDKHSQESLQRMRNAQSKVIHTKEWASKISQALKKFNANPNKPPRKKRDQYLKPKTK